MRVLVCGGRDYNNVKRIDEILDKLHAATPIAVLIEGGARGVDDLAGHWAIRHGVKVDCYPAEWRKHGRAAGPIRNQQMLVEGRPDLVVAFAGGRGTADMVWRARAAGVEVREIAK